MHSQFSYSSAARSAAPCGAIRCRAFFRTHSTRYHWGIPQLQSDWSLSCDHGLDYAVRTTTTTTREVAGIIIYVRTRLLLFSLIALPLGPLRVSPLPQIIQVLPIRTWHHQQAHSTAQGNHPCTRSFWHYLCAVAPSHGPLLSAPFTLSDIVLCLRSSAASATGGA